jgi:hypothetical protein
MPQDPRLCNLTIQMPKVERQALREIAEREDRTLGSLIRLGIRSELASKSESRPPAKGTAPEDARAGATSDRA